MIIGSKSPKVDVDEIRLLQQQQQQQMVASGLHCSTTVVRYRIRIFTSYSKKEIELV